MPWSRWDVNRARAKGQLVEDIRHSPARTELVRCQAPGCGACSRQLVGAGSGWLERHTARKHSAQKETLFP